MKAHRPVHVGVSFRRIKEKLDAAAWLLPLISDDGFHYVTLRFFISGQNGGRPVLRFKFLPGAVQEIFISNQIPIRPLVLKLYFDQGFLGPEIDDGPFEARLDQAFDRPRVSAVDLVPANDVRLSFGDD